MKRFTWVNSAMLDSPASAAACSTAAASAAWSPASSICASWPPPPPPPSPSPPCGAWPRRGAVRLRPPARGGEIAALEEQVEDRRSSRFSSTVLAMTMAERILQPLPVGEAHHLRRPGRVDALGRGDPQPGAAGGAEEVEQRAFHRSSWPSVVPAPPPASPSAAGRRSAACTASMSLSNFSSTFSVSRTMAWSSCAACSSTRTRAQSMVSLTEGSFFRSSPRSCCTKATSCRRRSSPLSGTREAMIRASSRASGRPICRCRQRRLRASPRSRTLLEVRMTTARYWP